MVSTERRPGYKYCILLLAFAAFLVSRSFYASAPKSVIWSDAEGYYMYLPAVFIYDGFEKVPPQSGQMPIYPGTNKYYTKYTCGVAILELPFFLATQAAAYILEKDTGGFTSLNNLGVRLAAIFYAMLGFYFLSQALKQYFARGAIMLTMVAIFLGTNLFYYTVREAGMSHVYSFFAFAVFIWLVPRFLNRPDYKKAALLGLIYGLIILIRPTNCIVILYLVLFEVYSFKQLTDRVTFLFRQIRFLWVMPLMMFLVFIPQLYYWYYISGNFLIYSYEKEGFIYWNAPKIALVLFDVQNGWLLYSPVLLLSIVGLGLGVFKKQFSSFAILLIIGLATYIFASWWAWWFGGAFGHRCFVEYYSFLCFPMAYFLTLLERGTRRLRVIFYPVIIFLIYYNIRLTYMYSPPWDGPDWNWEKFFEIVSYI